MTEAGDEEISQNGGDIVKCLSRNCPRDRQDDRRLLAPSVPIFVMFFSYLIILTALTVSSSLHATKLHKIGPNHTPD
jgi:hypothetical protein